MNTITLSQNGAKQAIEIALLANTPLMLYGSSGIGKSQIIKQVAEEFNLEVIDFRLSQVSPMDLN